MQWLWDKIQSEPNALSELVRQFLYLLIGFQLIQWTEAQQGLVLAFVSGFLTFIVRGRVIPASTIVQAGQSVSQIKLDAAAGAVVQENIQRKADQDMAATQTKADKDKKMAWLLPLLLTAAIASNCAVKPQQGKTLQQVDLIVYIAISAIDDVEMSLYKTKVLSDDTHKKLNPVMLNTLKAGRAANDALIAWPKGEAKPPIAAFAAALDSLNAMAKAVVDFTPDGPAREQLKTRIDVAISLIRGILIGFGGTA